jgi:hypothetical protein
MPWIIKTSNNSPGELRWRYSTFEVEVFHPTCPNIRLGFTYSPESLSKKNSVIYGGIEYSTEKFLEVSSQKNQETIARAINEAKENLTKLKMAEVFD